MLARTFADLSAGMDASTAISLLDVATRTWRRWLQTGSAPDWAVRRLVEYRYGIPVSARGWDGFTFREGELWTPESVRVSVGEVRALPYLKALNRELQLKASQPQQWRLL